MRWRASDLAALRPSHLRSRPGIKRLRLGGRLDLPFDIPVHTDPNPRPYNTCMQKDSLAGKFKQNAASV
jgi:hypothetical protein